MDSIHAHVSSLHALAAQLLCRMLEPPFDSIHACRMHLYELVCPQPDYMACRGKCTYMEHMFLVLVTISSPEQLYCPASRRDHFGISMQISRLASWTGYQPRSRAKCASITLSDVLNIATGSVVRCEMKHSSSAGIHVAKFLWHV